MNEMLPIESTGNEGLDAILGGGLPSRSLTLIAGEPGSGKTILTLQMLFHSARQGKTCLYCTTLSEPAIKVMRYMQSFAFFDEKIFREKIIFVDLGATIRKGVDAVIEEIGARVEEHEPQLVAIDSYRVISEMLRNAERARAFIYDITVRLTTWGATTLLVGEYARSEYSSFPEFAVADGILRLGTDRQELTSVREVEVLKLRGANPVSGIHFCEIGRQGVSFFPRVRAPELPADGQGAPSERAPFGVAGLDEMIEGGLPLTSSTVIQGATGSGKTMLGLQFLIEGARRGEKGVLFTQEENPEQLRAIAAGLGWTDLAKFEKEGLLAIRYTSPVELSTDRYLHEARLLVAQLGAKRAVFDSLTTIELGVPSERRFKELVYAITKHLRAAGVTLVMTMEVEQQVGAATLSGHGVSFIADNLIQLRYVEWEGKLERALAVLKSRGTNLNSQLRSLTIGSQGLSVEAIRFQKLQSILTGLPVMSRP
jgi:circadian clock protein KaiC